VERVQYAKLFLYTAKTGQEVYVSLPEMAVKALDECEHVSERHCRRPEEQSRRHARGTTQKRRGRQLDEKTLDRMAGTTGLGEVLVQGACNVEDLERRGFP
jgi:hypothetical protein